MQERMIQIKGIDVCYKTIGEGEAPVVLLHGWGLSSDRYLALVELILGKDGRYTFYIPDLPGFGKTPEPGTDWTLDDYVDFTKQFIEKAVTGKTGFELVKELLKECNCGLVGVRRTPTQKVILMGHSFGGLTAIKFASQYADRLELLVLTGAAGIKHPYTLRKKISRALAKSGKHLFALAGLEKLGSVARRLTYRIAGEKDYVKASPRMKAVMRNVLGVSVLEDLKRIPVPALLIWGSEDHSTPLEDGFLMAQLIPKSQLIVINGANHSVPYNRAEEFSNIFIRGYQEPEL